MTTLATRHVEFFEARGISPELAAKFEIYTGTLVGEKPNRHVVANPSGNILVYPFIEHGVVVNEKYRTERDGEKFFWHRKGGKRTFWNADVLDDPLLEAGTQALVITEGIEDGMVAIDCGWPLTVSVPDGAPPVPKDGRLPPLDPQTEASGKFEFLWLNRDRLKRIKRFILAVDDDGPGQRLAAEIVRRLGAVRCLFVTFPPGCKDLNEVLRQCGRDAVSAVLREAKQYPVRGLYRLSEYPALPALHPISIGWPLFDGDSVASANNAWLKLFPGEFMVVTGIPSHGKSTWVLNVLVNIARAYGWRSAVFSAEMPTVPHLRDKLRRIIAGTAAASAEADEFIEGSFTFIDHDPNDADEEDITLEWIIEKARDAVLRDGIRVLVIDPWNEIEHARRRDESSTEYIGRAIRMLKRFGRQYEVAVIVLAHPTKDVWEHGRARTATLYDIEGSAHWFNKCDHGVVIERAPEANRSTVHIAKVRFEETGFKGAINMGFDVQTQRFEELAEKQKEMALE
ncbi:AAA family ATPase [Bradyrhizobium barranii subsp. barranii]|uniref:AAA family ATPase n=1 Tax=Bradyrhizobium barranii subsp. barranii TaxID=2823807 RepID=A0A7Z0QHZ5_9BRAD|nr:MULTISPECIES: DnaB-like helicase C-terminal domain-containing protein [Bradyrhizobium]UEM11705.1 AAA family ATPase [Bradyrhizobium barranii subsp. barranii]UGX90290.1 AAA family ATPase [Bradyrhizobium barranii subsp. barranii]UQE01135.1 AAA family ATPase [Bradyrhizobium japonicum]